MAAVVADDDGLMLEWIESAVVLELALQIDVADGVDARLGMGCGSGAVADSVESYSGASFRGGGACALLGVHAVGGDLVGGGHGDYSTAGRRP